MIRLFTYLFIIIAFVWPTGARGAISGVYTHIGGSEVNFTISIDSPPPSSLIITHVIPPGNTVKDTTPNADKIKKRTVKWLLKNNSQGIMSFHLDFTHPVSADSLYFELRYRKDSTGSSQSIRVHP